MPDLDLLRRIDEQIIAATSPTREVLDVGAFRLMTDPSTDLIYLNYAVPTKSGPFERDIAPMVKAFKELGRRPRLEFRAELWPGLSEALEEGGFELEAEQPVLICTPETFLPARPFGIEVEILHEHSNFALYCKVADQAFGGIPRVDAQRIASMRRNIKLRNYVCGLARVGSGAAACACITPYKGVCELTGVGTLPEYRRMGVASAVCSRLMEEHFKTGDLVWLSAGSDASQAVYERLGFQVVATQKNYVCSDG